MWQYYHDFANLDWQVLAAHGYVVLAVNPRGSSGRGEKFATAIWAKWGQKDAEDVLAAVDWAVAKGIADPGRLGTSSSRRPPSTPSNARCVPRWRTRTPTSAPATCSSG